MASLTKLSLCDMDQIEGRIKCENRRQVHLVQLSYRDILSIRKLHFLKLNTHLNRDFLIFKKARYSFTGIFDDLAHFIVYRYFQLAIAHRPSPI